MPFIRAIGRFFRRDEAQDLAEYCLITAAIVLVAGGILIYFSGGMKSVWGTATQTINSAAATAGQSGGASGGQTGAKQ